LIDSSLKAVSGQVFTGAISATNLSGTNTGDQTLRIGAAPLASPTFTGTVAIPNGKGIRYNHLL
jgi:hypothetical protein